MTWFGKFTGLLVVAAVTTIFLFMILESSIPSASSLISGKKSHPTPVPVFNISLVNSTLPALRELYPEGYEENGPSKCEETLQLLIVVFSAPEHIERREAIRSSWASPKELPPSVRVLFLIGQGGNTELFDESTHDVITGNFLDTYRNLTLKSVCMLEWITKNCQQVQYVLKADDDVYVNVLKLIVQLQENLKESNVIVGRITHEWRPIRKTNSKYYISVEEFSQEILPDFATGPAYVIDGTIIPSLFSAALDESWLTLEDVFLTGLVAARIGVRLLHWPAFVNDRTTFSVCNAQRLLAIHNVKPREQNKLLQLSKKPGRTCKLKKN